MDRKLLVLNKAVVSHVSEGTEEGTEAIRGISCEEQALPVSFRRRTKIQRGRHGKATRFQIE
jgi:hypothetical protein